MRRDHDASLLSFQIVGETRTEISGGSGKRSHQAGIVVRDPTRHYSESRGSQEHRGSGTRGK